MSQSQVPESQGVLSPLNIADEWRIAKTLGTVGTLGLLKNKYINIKYIQRFQAVPAPVPESQRNGVRGQKEQLA